MWYRVAICLQNIEKNIRYIQIYSLLCTVNADYILLEGFLLVLLQFRGLWTVGAVNFNPAYSLFFPPSGPGLPHYPGCTITLRHTTLGSTPLDEWSARCRDLYITTHNTHKRQTSMSPVGFEPAIPASARPQTHALDHAATGIDPGLFNTTHKRPCEEKFGVKAMYLVRNVERVGFWSRLNVTKSNVLHFLRIMNHFQVFVI
jgi:hypothetical protein